jgi:hypothetical protein
MKKSPKKQYWEMNLEELREATKEFDKPIPAAKIRPMTKAERALWEKARKGPVRSIFISRHPRAVTLELSEAIITRSMQYAQRHKMTLAEVVERSLCSALSFAE